jgi:hypothetical protein
MKLHELGAQRPTEQAAMVLENQGGKHIDFSIIGPRRAQGMLAQVQRLLHEHRRSPGWHQSQQDPAYVQLVIMEQALLSRVEEMQAPGAVTVAPDPKSPQAKNLRRKAQTSPNTLTTQEKAQLQALGTLDPSKPGATTVGEGSKRSRMVREQSELQQAQVVLAAQDMIDRLQGMLEDVSEMQFKDLPALSDSIKNDMGVEQSTQFQAAASTAMTTLLQALQAGKTELESAQGILTGQPMVMPGSEPQPTAPPMTDVMPGEEDLDLDANVELDQEEPETGTAALGRERR